MPASPTRRAVTPPPAAQDRSRSRGIAARAATGNTLVNRAQVNRAQALERRNQVLVRVNPSAAVAYPAAAQVRHTAPRRSDPLLPTAADPARAATPVETVSTAAAAAGPMLAAADPMLAAADLMLAVADPMLAVADLMLAAVADPMAAGANSSRFTRAGLHGPARFAFSTSLESSRPAFAHGANAFLVILGTRQLGLLGKFVF
jgi:hypothetical protein